LLTNTDSETEEKVLESIKRAAIHRTSIMIAHRLSTIFDSSKIIVIEDGAVSQQGNHESLVSVDGKYLQLWRTQMLQHEGSKHEFSS